MKIASFLVALIFNWLLWTFVKTTSIEEGLADENEDMKKDLSKIVNDEAGSSDIPQIQKYKETLKSKLKNTKETDRGDKLFNKNEYDKEYYRKNKERMLEKRRNYYEKNKAKELERKRKYREHNKEKINEYQRNYYEINKNKLKNDSKSYYEKNKDTVLKKQKIYKQDNKEKRNEYLRKSRQKKKNVQSDNIEGTLFVNPQTGDFINKGKLPIVCQMEGNTLLNHEEKEKNNGEDEQNQIEIKEPIKILEDDTNQIYSNNKIRPFDLNEYPEDEKSQD
ncbi:unnamed protein product [Meloidogyne enterolobii]|uniref:Uncharacterized protein n=1 Tax=Meloidogyne enterolobii TaxID=390850 RepID=A0ACB1A314_MELEN